MKLTLNNLRKGILLNMKPLWENIFEFALESAQKDNLQLLV